MFQAELAAIHCIRKVDRWSKLGKSVAIFSDSQTTFKAISSANG